MLIGRQSNKAKYEDSFLVIFSALFLSGCPGKTTPPQTTREEPQKYYKKSKGY